MTAINITKVTIARNNHNSSDQVILQTDLDETTYLYNGKIVLTGWIKRDNTEDFVRKHFFDLPIEVINITETHR